MNGSILSLLTGIGPWAVAAMAAIAYAETGIIFGFFLPGDSMLFSAGVLVASGALHVPLPILIAVVSVAAFLGDQTAYTIGRRVGPKVVNRPDSRLSSPRHIDRARTFFDRHGPKAVILARFVPFARTFTPVIAGVGAMRRRTFAVYNAVGAVAWVAIMTLAGAMLGGVPLIADHIELVTVGLVALSLTPVVATAWRTRRRNRHAKDVAVTPGKNAGRDALGPAA